MRKMWVKWICAVLCVVSLSVAILTGVLAGVWYSEGEDGFGQSWDAWDLQQRDLAIVTESIQEWVDKGQIGTISVPIELSTKNSNFRYLIFDREKTAEKILGGNVESYGALLWEVDFARTALKSFSYLNGFYELDIGIYYGVSTQMPADDGYWNASWEFAVRVGEVKYLMAITIPCLAVGLFLLILLMAFSGRRQGKEGVVLTWHEHIPFDLYLVLQGAAHVGIWAALLTLVDNMERYLFLPAFWGTTEGIFSITVAVVCALAEVALALALILTTVVRLKARILLRNTVIARLLRLCWRILKAIGRGIHKAYHMLPMVWRGVLAFAGYLFVTLMIVLMVVSGQWGRGTFLLLQIIWQGFALILICRWVFQWNAIRKATAAVVAGKTDVQIDTAGFYPDLKQHALQLNDLGHAIDAAVEERMKSERFRGELITNVSHDLKTPLTSIINYVDLLKKEEIDSDTAKEYIEVLDRKSQRLKKLTEDLVEASKASTGVLTVVKEQMDLNQLIRQAMGEYEEKLTEANLTPVLNLSEEELPVNADGRHMWRVMDNLLNNCVKYAMEGTRVYVDIQKWEDEAVITVKNISRQGLNVSAEQLMERFVRGDESRTTEGSGLGLSIARSLVELQGGQFALEIDGDLFKTRVILPLGNKIVTYTPENSVPHVDTDETSRTERIREEIAELLQKFQKKN